MTLWLSFLFTTALFSFFFSKSEKTARIFLLTFFGVGFLGFGYFLVKVFSQTSSQELGLLPLIETFSWAPDLGLELKLKLDGLSLIFLGLITGLGFFIQIYASIYFKEKKYWSRYLTPICLFMASMIGLSLADNLILFFIFWELTSLSSYFLIAFDRENEKSRKNARNALLITLSGGICLLAGFLILASSAPGILNFSDLPSHIDRLSSNAHFKLSLILILVGVFTKSAQWPFHFWLPGAMSAPAPVSAYLHSATLVKAGIFLALRMTPAFKEFPVWTNLLLVFGGITFFWSSLVALFETEFKKILAYTTLAALGLCLFLIGINTKSSFLAMFVFLIAHGLYKAPLFLAAGVIEKALSVNDLRPLGRLWKILPVLVPGIIFCALSMGGFPPFFGFVAKELIFEALLNQTNGRGTLFSLGFFTLGSLLTIAVSLRFAATLVLRRPSLRSDPKLLPAQEKITKNLSYTVNFMAFLSFIFAVFPGILNEVLKFGLQSVFPNSVIEILNVELHLWHGFNILLLFSLILLLGGILLYFYHHRVAHFSASERNPFLIVKIFENCLEGLLKIGGRAHQIVQNGKLPNYVFVFFLVLTFTLMFQFKDIGLDFFYRQFLVFKWVPFSISIYEISLFLVLLGATVYCGVTESGWGALILLGVVGYCVALVFSNFGAPDLAMTQICIESLALIIFVKLLPTMPPFKLLTSKLEKNFQIVLSVFLGLAISLATFITLTYGPPSSLTPFFNSQSLMAANGRNVVNVIIVDFRGLDTLGEISVLAIAALGIAGLLGFGWYSGHKALGKKTVSIEAEKEGIS